MFMHGIPQKKATGRIKQTQPNLDQPYINDDQSSCYLLDKYETYPSFLVYISLYFSYIPIRITFYRLPSGNLAQLWNISIFNTEIIELNGLFSINVSKKRRVPSSNQTWQWKIPYLQFIFPTGNLHLYGIFQLAMCEQTGRVRNT